jgi:hypothetical protein
VDRAATCAGEDKHCALPRIGCHIGRDRCQNRFLGRHPKDQHMSNVGDDDRSRRNIARVGEILWREWDPIGVNTTDCPDDEYDRYAASVYVMLMNERRSAEDIATHLHDLATRRMGLRMTTRLRDLCRHAAETLVQVRPEFDAQPKMHGKRRTPRR